jgi:uncharacterized protein YjbI with pentapeptide repeats
MNILKRKDPQGANLKGANLIEAKLEGAHHLSLNQFSKVKTLHSAKLDKKILPTIKRKVSSYFRSILLR